MASNSKGYTINEDLSVTYSGAPTAEMREKAEKELVGLRRERASEGYDVDVDDVDVALSDGSVDQGANNQPDQEV